MSSAVLLSVGPDAATLVRTVRHLEAVLTERHAFRFVADVWMPWGYRCAFARGSDGCWLAELSAEAPRRDPARAALRTPPVSGPYATALAAATAVASAAMRHRHAEERYAARSAQPSD